MALIDLPMLRESKTIKLPEDYEEITLNTVDKKKLETLNKVLSISKSSNNSTYTLWARYVIVGKGNGSGVELEAMLSFWLSWYVLPRGAQDGPECLCVSSHDKISQGQKVSLAPIYLGC